MKKHLLTVLLLFGFITPCLGANLVYMLPESAITFTGSGGDVAITLNNLAAGTARISAQYDRGAGAHARPHTIRGVMEFETAPAAGEFVSLWLVTSDGTDPDGQEGTSDAAVGAVASLDNTTLIGNVICTTATVDHQFTATFTIDISTRYYSIVVYNQSAADNLQATANTCWIESTPVPDQIQ